MLAIDWGPCCAVRLAAHPDPLRPLLTGSVQSILKIDEKEPDSMFLDAYQFFHSETSLPTPVALTESRPVLRLGRKPLHASQRGRD